MDWQSTQLLAVFHLLPRLHKAAENAARRGEHIGHLGFLHNRGKISAVAVIAQQTHPAEIPQHRRYGLLCAALIDFIRLLGVDAEGVRFSDLPVVVQSGRVDGLRFAHDHIGQAEQIAQTCRLVAGIHNAHMGHKIAGQIAFFPPLQVEKQVLYRRDPKRVSYSKAEQL